MNEMEIPESELEAALGPVGMDEYRAAEDWDKPKVRQWVAKLRAASDEEFVVLCASAIHDSALMQSFRGNHSGIDARATACHFEARRRHTKAGHARDCRGDTLYTAGFNQAFRSQGYTPGDPRPCTCGLGG